jgi:hypothetical protein
VDKDTINNGLFRIYLGIGAIVLGMGLLVASFMIYYYSPALGVFPELVFAVGQLFLLGSTLLGLGVYKHIKLSNKQSQDRYNDEG